MYEYLLIFLGIVASFLIFDYEQIKPFPEKVRQGRPKTKWREQVEENMKRIGLRKEDAADQCRWRKGVGRVAEIVGCIQPPPFTGDI